MYIKNVHWGDIKEQVPTSVTLLEIKCLRNISFRDKVSFMRKRLNTDSCDLGNCNIYYYEAIITRLSYI